MKYSIICILWLLTACEDRPHTSALAVPERRNQSELLLNKARNIYQQNCASCHHPIEYSTGPATISVIHTRSVGWLDTFFNHRRRFKPDSAYRARVKEYGFPCPEIPISKEHLDAIQSKLHTSHGCVVY